MQQEINLNQIPEVHIPHHANQLANEVEDLQISVEKIQIQTATDIYRMTHGSCRYIIKAFRNQFKNQYERQYKALETLKNLKCPHIVKMIELKGSGIETFAESNKVDVLLFVEAQYGDMLQYISFSRGLPEQIVKYFVKEVLTGLSIILKNQILHPNLNLENLLLNQQREVEICGWSGVSSITSEEIKQKHLVFKLAEIAFCMLTSHMPFLNKNPKNDQFYKFINPKYIHKFWQIYSTNLKKQYQNFEFSLEFKKFIEEIFFQKLLSLESLLQHSWLKDIPQKQHVVDYLQQRQLQLQQRKNEKMQKEKQSQQAKQRLFKEEFEMPTLIKQASRSQEIYFFIADFEQASFNEENLKQLTQNEINEFQRFLDQRPNFFISSVKSLLRNYTEISSLSLELPLISHKTDHSNNIVRIQLKFGLLEDEQSEGEGEFEAEELYWNGQIELGKSKNQLFWKIGKCKTNLNRFYQNELEHLLRQKLQR